GSRGADGGEQLALRAADLRADPPLLALGARGARRRAARPTALPPAACPRSADRLRGQATLADPRRIRGRGGRVGAPLAPGGAPRAARLARAGAAAQPDDLREGHAVGALRLCLRSLPPAARPGALRDGDGGGGAREPRAPRDPARRVDGAVGPGWGAVRSPLCHAPLGGAAREPVPAAARLRAPDPPRAGGGGIPAGAPGARGAQARVPGPRRRLDRLPRGTADHQPGRPAAAGAARGSAARRGGAACVARRRARAPGSTTSSLAWPMARLTVFGPVR